MAYLKAWAPRAANRLSLRVPELLPRSSFGKGEAWRLDAQDAVERLEADVAYLDPPYNQHKYLGNYHVWESLVLWDKPAVYGTACKRVDCRERTSAFNARRGALDAFRRVVERVRARHLVVSFSDEGHLALEDVEAALAARGTVTRIARDSRRYVGAQIGIYNPQGVKVGRVSHLRNTEVVFVVSKDEVDLDDLQASKYACKT
jgi:adenine-specific DNA-methyltransferase